MDIDVKKFEKQMWGASQYATFVCWIGCIFMLLSFAFFIIYQIGIATGHDGPKVTAIVLTTEFVCFFLGVLMTTMGYVLRYLYWIAVSNVKAAAHD
ncbi:MAG: hypothetical protein MK100_09430 [Phycisphaerales bacterium]|nr:hypothetical protein [Phycisphaerales bacterium]